MEFKSSHVHAESRIKKVVELWEREGERWERERSYKDIYFGIISLRMIRMALVNSDQALKIELY